MFIPGIPGIEVSIVLRRCYGEVKRTHHRKAAERVGVHAAVLHAHHHLHLVEISRTTAIVHVGVSSVRVVLVLIFIGVLGLLIFGGSVIRDISNLLISFLLFVFRSLIPILRNWLILPFVMLLSKRVSQGLVTSSRVNEPVGRLAAVQLTHQAGPRGPVSPLLDRSPVLSL